MPRELTSNYGQTAAYTYNKPLDEVTGEQHRQAKVIDFGLLYGMGQVTSLGISQTEAKEIIKHYFDQFESVKGCRCQYGKAEALL